MKILVVSLLRLGDFIQITPVLSGYRKKFPKATIDVLVHPAALGLRSMLPVVDRWHVLDRDLLQAGMGRADVPLLTSFDLLREQCEALSAERYDLVVNLTHTEFSGWIAGYVDARARLGLAYDVRGQGFFHSPWFRYLNEGIGAGPAVDVLNHLDIFLRACDLEGPPHWPLVATEEGERELAGVHIPEGEWIVVQALTSDAKKNWGTSNWVRWMDAVAERRPETRVVLLGAPSERAVLEEMRDATADPAKVSVAILSLDGALALLNRTRVLVTGDTSIKHLANAARCGVIELSLGSSDWRRTGVFQPGSLIAQGDVPCAPCPHGLACSQPSHVCAAALEPAAMADLLAAFCAGDSRALTGLANRPGFSLYRTKILRTGFWFAEPLSNVNLTATVDTWLGRSVRKFLFDPGSRGAVPAYGSEGYNLGEEVGRSVPAGAVGGLLSHLDFVEHDLEGRRARCAREENQFVAGRSVLGLVDLTRLRATQNKIENERREIEITSKLIRSLRDRLADKS